MSKVIEFDANGNNLMISYAVLKISQFYKLTNLRNQNFKQIKPLEQKD
jgi:hypothetical protein